jgi:endonuclease III related protein
MTLSSAIAALPDSPALPLDAANLTAWQRSLAELLVGKDVLGPLCHLLMAEWSSPTIVAGQSLAATLELLRPIPRGPQKAGVVKALAIWWQTEFGDEPDPQWSAGLEHYRTGLRALRGLGPETVDRLLLFGAGLRVVPVDRATLRVAVRHGWLDLPVSDEETQATMLSGLGSSVADLRDGVRRLHSIGAEFCGRVPDCERCPLKPFLPAGGPLSPDAC